MHCALGLASSLTQLCQPRVNGALRCLSPALEHTCTCPCPWARGAVSSVHGWLTKSATMSWHLLLVPT